MIHDQCLYKHFWSTWQYVFLRAGPLFMSASFCWKLQCCENVQITLLCQNSRHFSIEESMLEFLVIQNVFEGLELLTLFFLRPIVSKLLMFQNYGIFYERKCVKSSGFFGKEKKSQSVFSGFHNTLALCFLPKELYQDQEWIVLKRLKCILVKMFCINEVVTNGLMRNILLVSFMLELKDTMSSLFSELSLI